MGRAAEWAWMRRHADPLPERDPREDTDWFRRLPEGYQVQFRADWARERERWCEVGRMEQCRFRRCLLEGALLLAGGDLMAGGGGLGPFLLSLWVGGVMGAAWWKLDVEVLLAPLIAMPLFAFTKALSTSGGISFLRFACTTFLVGAAASWMARERQLRVIQGW